MPRSTNKKDLLGKANLLIAIAAFIVSVLSFCFTFYIYRKSKEERISIIAMPITDNFTTKIYKIGKLDVVPFYWELTLSNNSDKPVSIIDIAVEQKGIAHIVSYSNLYGGIYSGYDKPLETPINLGSGESKKFAIQIGVLCDTAASEVINAQLETFTAPGSEKGLWIRRNVLLKMLADKGVDVYGNKTEGTFEGEHLLSYAVDPKKQQDFIVTFTTSNNVTYSKNVRLYMLKE